MSYLGRIDDLAGNYEFLYAKISANLIHFFGDASLEKHKTIVRNYLKHKHQYDSNLSNANESIGNLVFDDTIIDNIFDFIMSLPLKFNTIIGRDGMGLSQGQRQRILIARAVYKNPRFLFLDEATNALDAENERAIVENLAGFYKGRTTVVVAHRLSTVRNAGQIIVLGGGKVLETGTHSELTAKRGAYYNLVKNQLELGN